MSPTTSHRPDRDDVAIVGIGCRYPGVHGPQAFWDLIRSDRSTVSDVPPERVALGYDIDRYLDPRPRVPGRISSPYAGFLEEPDRFDPTPFGLTPRDVRAMEPQQRLMLEVTWDAIVDAGIPLDTLQGERVAVILGHMAEDYSRERIAVLGEDTVNRGLDVFTVAGMSRAVLSGRIAFLLGVTGPSFTLDTACSSSLIATHLACQSLRSGESRLALAGGVNLFLTPEGNIALSRSGMLSPDGCCKAFDAGANGFVRAEGAGVVLLRPLADALANDDPIYAVIRGTGISTDGRDGGHMMAPGRHGQAQAMRDAYARAGVAPADVDFVETHGTGTVIGDPVEIGALADVMGPGRPKDRPLRVSSVKGHIGHSESASGVAGLISAALSLSHRELPAQLHFEQPSPHIPWDEIPVRVQTIHEPWPGEGARLAGVNSFGISGTNAHVVLESAPERSARPADEPAAREPHVFPVTAHDDGALEQSLAQLAAQLRDVDPPGLADLAHTLARRRQHHPHRFAAVADSAASLADEIEAHLAGRPSGASARGVAGSAGALDLVLVFPGQGSQTAGMGQALLAGEPVFRASIEALDAAYARYVDWSLMDALRDPERHGTLTRLARLQPTLVAVEIALAELWTHWGVRPDAVVGQSMGEIAAAHAAGALDLDAVARLACRRGAVVERAAGRGAMALVGLAETAIATQLTRFGGRLEIAGSSAPSATIVSGDRAPLEAWVAELEARGVFARLLDVDFASHCFHMDPLLDDFGRDITGLASHAERVPFYSTVERRRVPGTDLGSAYWVKNLRAPVAFAATLEALIADGARRFVEVSPHPTLARAIPETAASLGAPVEYIPSLVRGRDERMSLRTGLAQLFVQGVPVDLGAEAPRGRVLRSGPYPYQRRRFWFGDRTRAEVSRSGHELLGPRVDVATDSATTLWQKTLDTDACPFLADHVVEGRPTVPGAFYIEVAFAAARAVWPDRLPTLSDLSVWPAIALDQDGRVTVQVSLRRDGPEAGEIAIMSRSPDGSGWSRRATCRVRVDATQQENDPEEPTPRTGEAVAPDAWHAALAAGGLALGPRMRTLRALTRHGATSEARLALPRLAESESHTYLAHPSLLEPCLVLADRAGRASSVIRVDEIRLHDELPAELRCEIDTLAPRRPGAKHDGATIRLSHPDGRPVGTLRGVRTRAIGRPATDAEASPVSLHTIAWRRLELPDKVAAPCSREWVLAGNDADAVGSLATELSKLGAKCHRRGVDDAAPGASFALASAGSLASSDTSRGVALLVPAGGRSISSAQRARLADLLEELVAEGLSPTSVWLIAIGDSPEGDLPFDPEYRESPARLAAQGRDRSVLGTVEVAVDAAGAGSALAPLACWMTAGCAEPHLAWHDQAMWAPRAAIEAPLQPVDAALRAAGSGSFAAHLQTAGEPEGVAWVEEVVPVPGAGEVRIAVEAAGLPQRIVEDVLGVPNLHPPGDGGLLVDVVGIVEAVGPHTTAHRVGDRVVAQGPLARHACVRASRAVAVHDGVDAAAAVVHGHRLADAAALLEATDLRSPSEGTSRGTVWVHGDADVGAALVSLAARSSWRVLASGVPEDRAAALSEAGIEVLPSSGTGDLSAALLASTGGDGVDVAINLASRLPIDSGLRAIRPGGHLVDAFPRGATDPGPVEGLRVSGGRSVQTVCLPGPAPDSAHASRSTAAPHSAERIRRALEHLLDPAIGLVAPTVFPAAALTRALRYVGQQRGAGPVAIGFDSAASTPVRTADGRPRLFSEDGVYAAACPDPTAAGHLADWMRERGAGQVVTMTAPPNAAVDAFDATLCSPGAALRGVIAVDPAACAALGSVTPADGAPPPPMKDGPEIDPDAGTAALDFFVHLRVGTPAPEASDGHRSRRSNDFGTRLADARRAAGQPITTVYLAEPSRPSLSFAALEAALKTPATPLPRVALARDGSDTEVDRGAALFADLAPAEAAPATAALREELAGLCGSQREGRVLGVLAEAVAVVTGMGEADRSQLRVESGLDELGLDSLMTLELAVALQRDLGIELDRGTLAPGQPLRAIATVVASQLSPARAAGAVS